MKFKEKTSGTRSYPHENPLECGTSIFIAESTEILHRVEGRQMYEPLVCHEHGETIHGRIPQQPQQTKP